MQLLNRVGANASVKERAACQVSGHGRLCVTRRNDFSTSGATSGRADEQLCKPAGSASAIYVMLKFAVLLPDRIRAACSTPWRLAGRCLSAP